MFPDIMVIVCIVLFEQGIKKYCLKIVVTHSLNKTFSQLKQSNEIINITFIRTSTTKQ